MGGVLAIPAPPPSAGDAAKVQEYFCTPPPSIVYDTPQRSHVMLSVNLIKSLMKICFQKRDL